MKQGPQVREGLVVHSTDSFEYDLDKYGSTPEELAIKAQFTIAVVVQRNRILRTRAMFDIHPGRQRSQWMQILSSSTSITWRNGWTLLGAESGLATGVRRSPGTAVGSLRRLQRSNSRLGAWPGDGTGQGAVWLG